MITLSPPHKKECLFLLKRISSKVSTVAKHGHPPASVLADTRFFIELLTDCCHARYTNLSYSAWLHIWTVLIYFTEHADAVPDHAHAGFGDDAEAYARIHKKFAFDIKRYRKFRGLTVPPRRPIGKVGKPAGSRP